MTRFNLRCLSGLYVIADFSFRSLQTPRAVADLLQPGVRLLQYRDKETDPVQREQRAADLKLLCEARSIALIINDDVALAAKINADGVHLGKDDMPAAQARALFGDDKIIGVSCYQSPAQAQAAERGGADYVALGALFPSPTKPEAGQISPALFSDCCRRLQLPVCAIGGIRLDNVAQALKAGADMTAVISDILCAPDPAQRVRDFLEIINDFSKPCPPGRETGTS